MNNKKLILFLLLLGSLFSFDETRAQNFQVLTNNNFQTTGGSAPQGQHRWCQTVFLVTAAEMASSGITTGQLINYIRLNQNVASAAPASGLVNLYFQNTSDTGYTKGGNWATAIGGMTQVHTSSPFTLPNIAGTYNIFFNTSNFTYTGGAIYVALEYSNVSGPLSTATNHLVTTLPAWGNRAARNTSATATPPASMLLTTARPDLAIGFVYTEDVTVTNIYTLGKMPIQFAAPTTIRANVRNAGSNPISNIDVVLNISGSNSFSDLVNIPGTLNPGQSQVITFAPYSPSVLSTNDVVSVTANLLGSTDLNLTNNTATWNQTVTQNVYTYKNPALPNNGGVGFNPNTTAKTATTGDFVAKFKSNPGTVAPYLASPKINEVKVDFFALPNTPALVADYTLCGVTSQSATPQPYQIGIWAANGSGTPGTLLWTSPTYMTAVGTSVIPVPNIAVSGDYFVGVRQINTNYCTAGNLSFAYQTENPIRSGTFYFTSPTGGTAWTDFAASNSAFRFSIEVNVEIPIAPECATNFLPADNGLSTCNVQPLTWSPNGGAPTGYDVYLSTNAADVIALAPAALVSSNQVATSYTAPSPLSSNTTYYWKIIPRNVNGPATGCPTLSFTTGGLPLCYCIPTYTGTICTASITEVAFNNLNNVSACFAPQHSIYPATGSTTTDIDRGGMYNLDVTTSTSAIVSVWIDYNHNGIFDASEWNQVSTATTAATPSTIALIIPPTALLGNTLMRIRSRAAGSANGPNDACTSFGSGESEDYIVNILPQPPCTGPTPGNTIASATGACPGQTVNLSIQNYNPGSGITYQWKNSLGAISGATNMTYIATPGETYSCDVTCSNSSSTVASTPVTVALNPILSCYCNTSLHSFAGPCISNITFNSLSNSSVAACALPAYTAYPASAATTTVYTGAAYNLTRTSTGSGAWTGVWIDYNHNYQFEASEYTELSSTTTGALTNTVAITIPPTALTGQTGMRIRQRTIDMTSADACTQNFGSGETEDYVIDIQVPVPCAGTPTAGTVSANPTSVCSGSGSSILTLTGATVGTGISYQWYNSAGIISGAVNTSFFTPVLSATESYYCEVTCSNSSLTVTSNTVTVTANTPPPGSSLANPIIIGQAPCIASPYTNTQSNTSNNCFTNNYTGTNNQTSPNIWYQFTLAAPATVQLSHCGTGFDTYIHLLDNTGTNIASNDDDGPLCLGTAASISQVLPAGTYYVVSEGFGTNTGAITTMVNTTNPCNTTLNLNCFIQGYWDGVSAMVPALLTQGQPTTPGACDSIDVILKDATTYTTVASTRAVLNQNGTCTAVFAGSYTGSYYIAIEHRSAIATWSAAPVSMAGSPSYNFTTANAQSYGPNMVEVAPGVWAFYSGDVVKDISESIEIADITLVELDNSAFAFGYIATDINADGGVDLSDFPLMEANINLFIFSNHP